MCTVATYNLYLGADLTLLLDATDADGLTARVGRVRAQLEATRFEERAAAVAALLARARPDLVGLQEVARWTRAPVREDGSLGPEEPVVDFLPLLLAALEAAGCRYDAHAVNENFTGGLPQPDGAWVGVTGANVTLVRADGPVRVTAARTAEFSRTFDLETGLPGVSFPVRRSWGSLDVELHGRRLRFVNTHTEAHDPATRDAQRDELLAALDDPGVPLVVVGDFNARPGEVGMPTAFVDAWTAGGGDPDGGPTSGQDGDLANPVSRLHSRIDYVWVRDLRVTGCRVVGDRPQDRTVPGGLWPSDHAGVVADLAF